MCSDTRASVRRTSMGLRNVVRFRSLLGTLLLLFLCETFVVHANARRFVHTSDIASRNRYVIFL